MSLETKRQYHHLNKPGSLAPKPMHSQLPQEKVTIQTLIIAFKDSLTRALAINFSGNVHPTSTI